MVKTTKITLTFSDDIEGLSLDDIFYAPGTTESRITNLVRLEKGVYELNVENVIRNGVVQVSMLKDGYNIRNPDGIFKFIEIFNGKDWYQGEMGTGTAADPFIVHNETTLRQVGTNINTGTGAWAPSAKYKQICDIKLDPPAAGQTENWSAPLVLADNGVYDGGGYRVSNIVINNNAAVRGFFTLGAVGTLAAAAQIKNLGLVNFEIKASAASSGGLIGYATANYFVKVYQCYVIGNIVGGQYLGGIAGGRPAANTIFENCYYIGNITSSSTYVGGINSSNAVTLIQNCYTMGVVRGTNYMGGITANTSTLKSCVALNAGILRTSGTSINIDRLKGGAGTTSKCYAEQNMIVISGPNNGAGNANGSGGQSVLPELYLNQNWWKDNTQWDTGFPWNFNDVWEWDNDKLRPVLKRGKPPVDTTLPESE